MAALNDLVSRTSDLALAAEVVENYTEPCDRKIFVGNIAYRLNWKHVKDFFSKFGKVNYVHIAFDTFRKTSKGFGFVEFATEEEYLRCLHCSQEELILEGRQLRIGTTNEPPRKRPQWKPQEKTDPDGVSQSGEDLTQLLGVDEMTVIFSFLPMVDQIRIERVCKRWKEMILTIWKTRRELVTRKNGFGFPALLRDQVMVSILRRLNKTIHTVDLSGTSQSITEYSLLAIGQHCQGLETLNLSGVRVSTKGLKGLSKQTRNLKTVILNRSQSVKEKGLWWLFNNCRNLEYVDISYSLSVTGKCFFLLNSSLKTMIANGCYWLTDFGLQQLEEKCPNLQQLQLMDCAALTNNGIAAVMNLSKLQVFHCGGLLQHASQLPWNSLSNLHELVDLKLQANPHITNTSLRNIARGSPKLRSLNLNGYQQHLTTDGLMVLSEMDNLKELDVGHVVQVTDAVLKRVASRGLLEKLVLHRCTDLTDEGLQCVLDLCPNLRELDVSSLFSLNLTSKVLTSLHQQCTRPQDLPLTIIIGGSIFVQMELDLDIHLEDLAPAWVTFERLNRSRDVCLPGDIIIMPDPYFGDSEDEDPADPPQNLQPAVADGGEPEVAAEAMLPLIVNRDGKLPDPEFYTGEWEEELLDYVPPPPPPPQLQPPEKACQAAFFDEEEFDDFDEDFDEFLDNDNPVAMERWNLS